MLSNQIKQRSQGEQSSTVNSPTSSWYESSGLADRTGPDEVHGWSRKNQSPVRSQTDESWSGRFFYTSLTGGADRQGTDQRRWLESPEHKNTGTGQSSADNRYRTDTGWAHEGLCHYHTGRLTIRRILVACAGFLYCVIMWSLLFDWAHLLLAHLSTPPWSDVTQWTDGGETDKRHKEGKTQEYKKGEPGEELQISTVYWLRNATITQDETFNNWSIIQLIIELNLMQVKNKHMTQTGKQAL